MVLGIVLVLGPTPTIHTRVTRVVESWWGRIRRESWTRNFGTQTINVGHLSAHEN
jgi:hypothetical protein